VNRENITDKMIELAQKEPEFAQKLLKGSESAKKAISEKGFKIPNGISIIVHQNTPSELHFILPYAIVDDVLDNDALEQIAGGKATTEAEPYWTGEIKYDMGGNLFREMSYIDEKGIRQTRWEYVSS